MPLELAGWLNYPGIRMVSTLLGGALWFSYRGLRAVWGDTLARLGALPAGCFFALATHPDFLSYSTEQVPVLLLAIASSGLLVAMTRETGFSPWSGNWLAAGVALGAVPFAKLQAVPMAAWLFLVGVTWATTRCRWDARKRVLAVVALTVALAVVPLGFAVMLTTSGVWHDFYISYLAQNGVRAGEVFITPADGWRSVIRLLFDGWTFMVMFAGAWALAALLRFWKPAERPAERRALFLLLGIAVVSVPFSVTPQRSVHHLLFLVLPTTLLVGGLMAAQWRDPKRNGSGLVLWRRRRLVVFFLALIVSCIGTRLAVGNPHVFLMGEPRQISEVAREILRHAQPGDRLSMWNYFRCHHHWQTRLPQGTRESHTQLQMQEGPYRDYFRRRYVEDLRRNRPRFFVDSGLLNVPSGRDTLPELREFIEQHYDLLPDSNGRIYMLRPAASAQPHGQK